MGKALVLKGVDFSVNKLDTDILSPLIPCTGISLSDNSISFASLTTATLTAVKTPSNTTEQVTWESSDTNVATVSDGIVTAVGIGDATITVSCGIASAICAVSVDIQFTGDDIITYMHKMNSKNATDLANGQDYMGAYGTNADLFKKYAMLFSPVESSYKALTGNSEEYSGKYPFIIPKNTDVIVFECPSTKALYSVGVVYMDSKAQPTYSVSYKGTKTLAISDAAYATNNKAMVTVPDNIEGLDSFICILVFSEAVDEVPSGFTISFDNE